MPGCRPDRPLAFVVVHDVAASWTTYTPCRAAPGLLLHAAGPTHEGYRTIDVWASDGAYERDRRVRSDRWPTDLAVPPVVRSFHVEAWLAPATE